MKQLNSNNNMRERLLYNGVKRIPFVFNQEEINSIFHQLISSNDYLKSAYGEWQRWRDISLIATMYFLALRPKEACCLKFSDFNFRTMFVKVSGKANKTGKDRLIPVPKILGKFYKQYLSFPKQRFWKNSQYLFPSMINSHISPGRIKHTFREKVLKPLNLWEAPQFSKVPRIRLYTLRHSRATQILNKQIKEHGYPDLFAIANFLGHADIRSSQVYLHTDDEYMEYLRSEVEI